MDVEVSVVAILLAFASSMVVGSIWYAKSLFGSEWMRLVGLNDKKAKEGMAKAFTPTIVAAFVEACLVAFITFLVHSFYEDMSWLAAALLTAVLLWLVQAVAFITHDAFEQRPLKLTLINVGNQLATLVVMGLIIGLFEL